MSHPHRGRRPDRSREASRSPSRRGGASRAPDRAAPHDHDPRPARRPVPRRQAGSVLALVMLAFMVIIVVAVQLTFSASVEGEHSMLAMVEARMGRLADAARLQAESALLLDLEDAEAGAGSGGGAGALDGGGVLDGAASDGGATEEDVAAVTARTDSKLDAWADPTALAPPMGDGLQVFVEVVDEDAKLNLLGMFAEEEQDASEAREILQRLLDVAFEGTTHDIDFVEAADVLDRVEEWTHGRRGAIDPVPVPELKKSVAQDDAETHQLDTSLFGDDRGQWPLSLDELVLMGPLRPHHLDGFVENDEFFPGLREYLTLDSHLELKPEPKKESVFAGSPFAGTAAAADEAVSDEALVAEATHSGLVNINTARLAVLRAVAGDDIPRSALELIVAFRDKIDEFDLDDPYSTTSMLGGFGGDSAFGRDASDGGADGEAADDEENVTEFVFTDPTEVFGKVEQEFTVEVAADSLQREAFERWFWVESQVFTIKILVRDPALGLQRTYRTTVWRMKASDRPRIVTLRPLEPYADPRRLQDYPGGLSDDRLAEMADDRLFATR